MGRTPVPGDLRHSPYLSALSERLGTPASLSEISADIQSASASDLLGIKARFALAFAKTEFHDFDEMGRVWSGFADATIDRALILAWRDAARRHRLKLPDGPVPGLFLLGLGKLGGQDLNISSDVDLIAFYDPDILPVPAHKGQAHIASDVCKRVTQILQPRHAPDFVWRVDWRLRPESSGTGLALSTAKAETFYFFRALPWHRLALMKARCVAGDMVAGQTFLERMEPFIWRRNLDFTTLDDLAALKARINDEHPGLETERAAPAPITPEAAGFNLKLGRGGIREIEFIANAQQLIHGGKRPDLRVTNTRLALQRLGESGLLDPAICTSLRENYAQFRLIENGVQMLRNAQTHLVPSGVDQEAMIALLELSPRWEADIEARRRQSHAQFASLFDDTPTAETQVKLSGLDTQAKVIARSWMQGFTDHGLPLRAQSRFQPLGQALVARVQKHERPNAFRRVDAFLRQLGRSEQYFALLDRHPDLLDTLITPLLHSPHMSEILEQSPHIIDIFLSQARASLAEQSAFVLTSPDTERRLEALRRFVNEQLFRAYTKFLTGESDALALQARLTAIAEATLSLSIQIIGDDLGVSHIPMTVMGLGKMGHVTMAPQSDLDLIFLFSDDCDPDFSAKVVRRMRTTLMTKLREGIAYELDMRLRPSGRSGPPAVKLSAFRDHHMNRAHSWEHIALAPARIVAGDANLGRQAMSIKAEIFNRPRNHNAFIEDAWAMFGRLSAERLVATPPSIWRTKLRRGGLMEADYVSACQSVLGSARDPATQTTIDQLAGLQIWERLLDLTGKAVRDTPLRFSEAIDVDTLPARIEALEQHVTAETERLFASVKTHSPVDPRPVIWD